MPEITGPATDLAPGSRPWLHDDKLLSWFVEQAEAMARAWNRPILQTKSSRICLLLVIVAVCLSRAYIGLWPTDFAGHDTFVLLDGAWRMMWGERPHIDFYTPLGVAAFLPTEAGMLLSPGSVGAFGYGQALAGLAIGIWSYLLGRDRLRDVPLLLFCVLATTTAVGVSAIGLQPANLTPGMTYNRYGVALLDLIVVEAVLPPIELRRYTELAGGLSTGFSLVILLFMKASFFATAAFMIGVLVLCGINGRKRLRGVATGGLAMLGAFCSYFGFHLLPMINDLRIAGGAKSVDFKLYFFDTSATGAACCVILSVSAAMLVAGQKGPAVRTLLIAGPLLALCGLMTVFTNYEHNGFPLIPVAAIVILQIVGGTGMGSPLRASLILWCMMFALGSIVFDAIGLYAGCIRAAEASKAGCLPFDGRKLMGFRGCTIFEAHYVNFANDGIRLLSANRRPDDSVLSLDFSNPFSYSLNMAPMHGGTVCMRYSNTFTSESRPSAGRMFGSATLVMAPKGFSDETLEGSVYEIYGHFLEEHFDLAAESRAWKIYRRKPNQPSMFADTDTGAVRLGR